MIVRVVELADKIGVILSQFPTAPLMLLVPELQSLKEFIELLQPFDDATKILSGESYVTGSKVIPMVNTLRTKLRLLTPESSIAKAF